MNVPQMLRGVALKPTAHRFFYMARVASVTGLVVMAAGPARAREPLDQRAATLRICTASPEASVARAQRLRGGAEVTAAGVLPNPALVVQHERSVSGSRERETVVGLSLPLGIGGRRFLLQDAALERQEQARSEAEDTLFESALAFRLDYVLAAAEHARVSLLAERQALLDGFGATIHGLAQSGEAAGYDVLRHQAQARAHAAAVEAAKARADARLAGLEAWVGTPITLQPSGGRVHERRSGVELRPAARARSLEAAARASSLEVQAANRKWAPDLDVFAGYRRVTAGPTTGHGLALALTLPITWFDHGQGDAARAGAEREFALASAVKIRREQQIEHDTTRLLIDGLLAALRTAEAASTRAVEVELQARALYAAGEAPISELLEAFRMGEEAQLAKLALEEELAVARIRRMRAAGSMFDSALDNACRDTRGRTK